MSEGLSKEILRAQSPYSIGYVPSPSNPEVGTWSVWLMIDKQKRERRKICASRDPAAVLSFYQLVVVSWLEHGLAPHNGKSGATA